MTSVGVTAAGIAAADDATCIAASERALTLRKQGQLRGALQDLAVCADPGCPDEVKSECTKRIGAIKSMMPTLVLAATDRAGNDVFAVKVTMDGAPLLEVLDGRPVAIDPGEHTFRFETAGQPPVEKTLVIREGEKDRRESILVGPAPVAPPPAPSFTPAPTPGAWNTQKTLGLVGGGVGLVGIGLGIVFGLYASSSQSREKSDCPAAGCAALAQGTEDYNTAKKDALGSTVAFAAGGAFLAAGAVLWLTAPATRGASTGAVGLHLAPAILGTGGGFSLGGDL
jgi:hypothetical protein